MIDLMDEIYFMMVERIGERCMRDSKTRILMIQKNALMEEIMLRLGDDGDELLDKLSDLSADLNAIESKALFRASVQLGTELARPSAIGAPLRRGTIDEQTPQ